LYLSQLRPPLLCPALVAVLRQKLSRVQIYGRPIGRRLQDSSGSGRRSLEGFDIDPQRAIGAQQELLTPKMQEVVARSGTASPSRGFEGTAGDVEGVVQVVEGGLRLEIRPEKLYRLLPVQPVPLSQGEQLDEACGLL